MDVKFRLLDIVFGSVTSHIKRKSERMVNQKRNHWKYQKPNIFLTVYKIKKVNKIILLKTMYLLKYNKMLITERLK